MLTGITKFGKVSVFSGLNNLKDISLLPKYNDICGISETEFHREFVTSVKEFAEENDLTVEETWESFKSHYAGYHFAFLIAANFSTKTRTLTIPWLIETI